MKRIALFLVTALFFTGSNCGKPKQGKRGKEAQVAKPMKKKCFECSQELDRVAFLQHQMRVNKALRAALSDGKERLDAADMSWIRQEYKRMNLPLCAYPRAITMALNKLEANSQ